MAGGKQFTPAEDRARDRRDYMIVADLACGDVPAQVAKRHGVNRGHVARIVADIAADTGQGAWKRAAAHGGRNKMSHFVAIIHQNGKANYGKARATREAAEGDLEAMLIGSKDPKATGRIFAA